MFKTRLLNTEVGQTCILIIFCMLGLLIAADIFQTSAAVPLDTNPPKIKEIIIRPSEQIMPWDHVNVTVHIVDNESGVSEVWLYYTSGESLIGTKFDKLEMVLVNGDSYNGVYQAFIPPHPPETVIWYYLNVSDRVGNYIIFPSEGMYKSYKVENPLSSISIRYLKVTDVNTKNRSIELEISFFIVFPSYDEPENISVLIEQVFLNDTIDLKMVNVPRGSVRFQYITTEIMSFILIGEPEKYPRDKYWLTLNFTFYWSNVDEIQKGDVILPYNLKGIWDIQVLNLRDYLSKDKSRLIITYVITLERSPKSRGPIEILIYSITFLAAMISIIPPKELSKRAELFLGLFIFNFTFLFSTSNNMPYTPYYTYAELTIMITSLYIVVAIVTSIICYALEKTDIKYKKELQIITDISILFIFLCFGWSIINSVPYLNSLATFVIIAYVIRILFLDISLPRINELVQKIKRFLYS